MCCHPQGSPAQRLVYQLPELLRIEATRNLSHQRAKNIIGKRVPDVVFASQPFRRGGLLDPRLEGDLAVLRQQCVGDDVATEHVVHGYERVATV
jgi:hypothetical protein